MYKNDKNQESLNQFQEHMKFDKFKKTKLSNKRKSKKVNEAAKKDESLRWKKLIYIKTRSGIKISKARFG